MTVSARGLDLAMRAPRSAEAAMADGTDRSMGAYVRAEAEFRARGGTRPRRRRPGSRPASACPRD
ncbi:hypothetical protein ACWGKA_18520 [Streptomyces luteogriseus]